MLKAIIARALENRWLVLAGACLIAVGGYFGLSNINIDAFPDTTPVQVQINTAAPALVAAEIERLITFPIEHAMGGMPGLQHVRSTSQYGISQVIATFDDGTDIYLARQVIQERLSSIDFPPGIPRPELGPVATGLGEVLHYYVKTAGPDGKNLRELRTVQDWTIRPELRTVPGSAEINSWGGLEKMYQVQIDPLQLLRYELTFREVLEAIQAGNVNVGGGYINRQGDMLLIHGIGRTRTLGEIEDIVVDTKNGTPIYIKDVGEVVIGHTIRRGIVTAEGQGEIVLGLGFMRIGANSYEVTQALRNQLDDIIPRLPPGARVETVYDRTELVDNVIATVRSNLCEGALFVVAILFLLLGNLRAGLIAAVTIPLSMLFAFIGMWPAGIAGTLLSLGAIDFGIVVDSSVVMLENILRQLGHAQAHGDPLGRTRLQIIRDAAQEVRMPTVFGQLIIMIVYLPILTLEGAEGKMFRPMALTVMLVMTGSLLLALTLTPVLASLLLPRQVAEKEVLLVRLARWLYLPLFRLALRRRLAVLGLGLAALVFAGLLAKDIGTEFVPQLSEGAIVIGLMRMPGTSLEQSAAMNTQMERYIKAHYPEVKHIWSRVGEPEVETDAGSPEQTDMFVTLHPRDCWRPHLQTQADLVKLMAEDLKRFKGQDLWFTQPIEMRINEMLTGSRSDLSLKLFGEDIATLVGKSQELARILRQIPGCADLTIEQMMGQPILEIRLKQEQLARYGIPAQRVLEKLEAISSKAISDVLEDQIRFPLGIRLSEDYRATPQDIASLMVEAVGGQQIPLPRLADIQEVRGPKLIASEWGKRRIALQCNVRGRDIGSFVSEAQRRIESAVELPRGFRLAWGGQFENMVRAQQRLLIAVPLALGLIVALLFVSYRNILDTTLVFASVPFACVGGLVALWVRDMPLSISAAVGFITLSGVSVLNSMIVVSYLRGPETAGLPLLQALEKTWTVRLRTILMTALVASVGFIPMAISTGTGAEVQRPLATVVIGGVLSSTLMTLFLLPALYALPARPQRSTGAESRPAGQR